MAQVNYLDNGLVFITKQTFSAVSSVSFDNCFSATYSQYKIIADVQGSSVGSSWIYLRSGGVDATSTIYSRQFIIGDSTLVSAARQTSQTKWSDLTGYVAASTSMVGLSEILNPYQSTYTTANSLVHHTSVSTPLLVGCSFGTTVTTSYDGFTYTTSTGTNITGTIYVYGYKES